MTCVLHPDKREYEILVSLCRVSKIYRCSAERWCEWCSQYHPKSIWWFSGNWDNQ